MQALMNERLLSIAPSGIRRFTNMARSIEDCAMLTIGEPDFNTPEAIKEACKQALDQNRTHYPQNVGDPDLREAVSAFEKRQNRLCYNPSEIIMTTGATEAIFTAMQGVLNPGDEVIIPQPAFSLYESIALLAGAKPVYLDTRADGFQIKKEKLASVINEKTKLIVLNSPNNPTGTVYSQETLDAIRDLVLFKPIFVLCDDVYNRLIYGACPQFCQFRELREQLLIIQSFSKPYAMTGWRVGYLMADQPIIEKLALYHAADVVSVPSFMHPACMTALEQDISPMVSVYQQRRDYIYGRIRDMGLSVVKPEGAFYIFPSVEQFGMDAETFCTRMIKEGRVAGVPGTCFGADGYIRFSYCYSMEAIEKAMDRLERFLQAL